MTSIATRKLRVAVVLSSPEDEGGGFVQSVNIAKLFRPETDDPYTVEYIATDRADASALRRAGIDVTYSVGITSRFVTSWLTRSPPLRALLRRIYRGLPSYGGLDAMAKKRGYDLLVFTSPSRRARDVRKTPFIYTIWDVCHRDHPEFPEISGDGSFDWREDLFGYALPRSSAFIVDTAMTATRLAALYGLDEGRAIVVPYEPSPEILSVPPATQAQIQMLRSKFGLARPYVYYPAQFWAHKNHAYILRALKILKERNGVQIDAVFSGSDQGNLERVLSFADRLGVHDNVKYVGFLPVVEVAALYREAIAVVMPTYFGPTNTPPLDAKALGCTLIYSDEPGFREFAGPEALYCDLTAPESLVACIEEAMVRPRPAPIMPERDNESRHAIRRTLRILAAKFDVWRME